MQQFALMVAFHNEAFDLTVTLLTDNFATEPSLQLISAVTFPNATDYILPMMLI